MNRLLLVFAGLYGFIVSARATSNIRHVAREAASGNRAAQSHFTQTRYARVYGPRNSDLGMVFYGLVFLASSTDLIRKPAIRGSLVSGSLLSLATSAYLLWALLFRLRVWCPICMRGHAINVVTFLLLLRSRRAPRRCSHLIASVRLVY